MTAPTTVQPDSPFDSSATAPVLMPTRPLYWSVKRELWENRSIYLAPLIVAVLVLFGSLISTMGLPKRIRAAQLDPAKLHAVVVSPYSVAPAPIILVTFLVGIFYCLDALYGERRDRSILFWKSLPVSDVTTVLSKASIPLVVLPVIAVVLGMVTEFILLMTSIAVLTASGNAGTLWGEFRLFQQPIVMIYGLTVHVLWFAPIYAWLLLISAWARRTPVLWAALPPFAIAMVERIVFRTSYFGSMLKYRVIGAMTEAFVVQPKGPGHGLIDQLVQLDPAKFLSAPGLWVGLIFAAACLAASVRLRHDREPI